MKIPFKEIDLFDRNHQQVGVLEVYLVADDGIHRDYVCKIKKGGKLIRFHDVATIKTTLKQSPTKRQLHIETLSIEKNSRKLGIGEKLLDMLVEYTNQMNCDEITAQLTASNDDATERTNTYQFLTNRNFQGANIPGSTLKRTLR